MIAGSGLWWFSTVIGKKSSGNLSTINQVTSDLEGRLSEGSRVLVPSRDNEAKLFAAKAIAEGKTSEAINLLTSYLAKYQNDPEALIYLNNAKALAHNPVKIAVVVPIKSNLNVAQEMLRGYAQGQNEINNKGGLRGRYVSLLIVDDSNEPEIAKQVAQILVKTPEIVAVIGHNASNATLSAAPIYQAGQLVLVNSTSLANGIADIGNYIFRVVPSTQRAAQSLAQDVIKNDRKIAICYDAQAPDGVSFMQEFVAALLKGGGQQVPTVCDLSNASLNPQQQLQEAIANGADSLLLLPHVDRLQAAYALAELNQSKLQLYGNSPLGTIKTLERGSVTQGLIIPVPWSAKTKANAPFADSARQIWGGDVSWRTAGSYDAIYAIANGLAISQSREGLKQALGSANFASVTRNGTVKFLPNGDREGPATLVQVKPSDRHQTGYDFFPLN
ncbi:MAG: ABC transporter substrate-binding protein [Snowella sp.]|nr:ABC transporter substrate-binding protein [Snowella sp.]